MFKISKQQLKALYWSRHLTSFQIADDFGCSAGTVINRMREYSIRRRNSGPKRIRVEKAALEKFYVQKGFSTRTIARIFHCDPGVIIRALEKHHLAVRPPKMALQIPKKELRELYHKQKLSTYGIAAQYGCDPKTVYKYLKLYRIPTRPLKQIQVTRGELEMLYSARRYSLKMIARQHGCHPSSILNRMKRYEIPRRSISETSTKHLKNDFSGNKDEKTYLLGFRTGDLHVMKSHRLIGIGCGTTKNEQLDLIKKLFKDYGPYWISKPDKRGARHIDCSVNRTFRFLLTKPKKIPKWILRREHYFIRFLAGYTDAEGSIGVYQGHAKFRIGSYDIGILRGIHQMLRRMGVNGLLRLEDVPHIDKRGIRHNGNFWRLTVNDRYALKALFTLLNPCLFHRKRRFDLLRAEKNVVSRLS